jgi:hypothetical protein
MVFNSPKPRNDIKEFGDFARKWVGKKCFIVFHDGSSISGKINDNQKFFIEIIDSTNNKVIYLNKAYIKEIIVEE